MSVDVLSRFLLDQIKIAVARKSLMVTLFLKWHFSCLVFVYILMYVDLVLVERKNECKFQYWTDLNDYFDVQRHATKTSFLPKRFVTFITRPS